MQDSTGAMFEHQIDRQALVTLIYLYDESDLNENFTMHF